MSMYVILVLIDYLIGSSRWRDDWSSRMKTRDDLASSKKTKCEAKAPTETTSVTSHGLSSSIWDSLHTIS